MSYASEFDSISKKFERPGKWLDDEIAMIPDELKFLEEYKQRLLDEIELTEQWIKEVQVIQQQYGNT
jgi:hypothetical protein